VERTKLNLRVALLGATGVYGRHLLPRLSAAGCRVRALVRNPASARVAAACGAELIQADIFDESALRAGLSDCDVAINLATSLPNPSTQRGDFAANDRLRREGTPVWLRACRSAGVARVLQQSIAMVHAGGGDSWADEDTDHALPVQDAATQAFAAARDMEASVVSSGLDYAILRGALFYGAGTGFDDEWFARAAAGKLRLPGEGRDYVSLVHIADMAAATVAALERWPTRKALIIADDQPTTWLELLGYVCAVSGVAPPAPGGRASFPSFRVTNRRARELLAWAPRYESYRAGLIR
jgi:nucleoside-diphosphate-sugar epimerase